MPQPQPPDPSAIIELPPPSPALTTTIQYHGPRSLFTLTQVELERMKLLAEMLTNSTLRYSKINNAPAKTGDLFIIMLKGIEVGLEPMAALDLINIIQGVPTLSPQGMLALIYNREGELEDIKITDDGKTCTVTMKRHSRTPHTETFSMEDARKITTTEQRKGQKVKIPLTEKYNWVQMPKVMRKWRCVAAACRVVFPDVIQGLYTPEEINPDLIINEQGEIIAMPQADAGASTENNNPPASENQPGGEDAPQEEQPAYTLWSDNPLMQMQIKNLFKAHGLDPVKSSEHVIQQLKPGASEAWTSFGDAAQAGMPFAEVKDRIVAIAQQPPPQKEPEINLTGEEVAAIKADVWAAFDGLTPNDIEKLLSKPIASYKTPATARKAIKGAIKKHHLPVVSEALTYYRNQNGNSTWAFFHVPQFDFNVRRYGARTFLTDCNGKEWRAVNALDAWEPSEAGKTYEIDAVKITWEEVERNGKPTGTYNATHCEAIEVQAGGENTTVDLPTASEYFAGKKDKKD